MSKAIHWRVGFVPAKDVSHRRSRRHCDCRTDIGRSCAEVCLSYHSFTRSNIPLSNFMRQQAMAERMIYNRPIPANRLVSSIADSTAHMHLNTTQRSDESIKRHRSTPKNTGVDRMGSDSSWLDLTKPVHTSMSSHLQATRMSTLPCPLVLGVKVPRPTSKNITRVSQIVRNF